MASGTGATIDNRLSSLWHFSSRRAARAYTEFIVDNLRDSHGRAIDWSDPQLAVPDWVSDRGEPLLPAVRRTRVDFNATSMGKADPDLARVHQAWVIAHENNGAGRGKVYVRDLEIGRIVTGAHGLPARVEAIEERDGLHWVTTSDGTTLSHEGDAKLDLGDTIDTSVRDATGAVVGHRVLSRSLRPGDAIEAQVDAYNSVTGAVERHIGSLPHFPRRVTIRATLADDQEPDAPSGTHLIDIVVLPEIGGHEIGRALDMRHHLPDVVVRLDAALPRSTDGDQRWIPREQVTFDKLARGDLVLDLSDSGLEVLGVHIDARSVMFLDLATGGIDHWNPNTYDTFRVIRAERRDPADLAPPADTSPVTPSNAPVEPFPRGGAEAVADMAAVFARVRAVREAVHASWLYDSGRAPWTGFLEPLRRWEHGLGPAVQMADTTATARDAAAVLLSRLVEESHYTREQVAGPLRALIAALDTVSARFTRTVQIRSEKPTPDTTPKPVGADTRGRDDVNPETVPARPTSTSTDADAGSDHETTAVPDTETGSDAAHHATGESPVLRVEHGPEATRLIPLARTDAWANLARTHKFTTRGDDSFALQPRWGMAARRARVEALIADLEDAGLAYEYQRPPRPDVPDAEIERLTTLPLAETMERWTPQDFALGDQVLTKDGAWHTVEKIGPATLQSDLSPEGVFIPNVLARARGQVVTPLDAMVPATPTIGEDDPQHMRGAHIANEREHLRRWLHNNPDAADPAQEAIRQRASARYAALNSAVGDASEASGPASAPAAPADGEDQPPTPTANPNSPEPADPANPTNAQQPVDGDTSTPAPLTNTPKHIEPESHQAFDATPYLDALAFAEGQAVASDIFTTTAHHHIDLGDYRAGLDPLHAQQLTWWQDARTKHPPVSALELQITMFQGLLKIVETSFHRPDNATPSALHSALRTHISRTRATIAAFTPDGAPDPDRLVPQPWWAPVAPIVEAARALFPDRRYTHDEALDNEEPLHAAEILNFITRNHRVDQQIRREGEGIHIPWRDGHVLAFPLPPGVALPRELRRNRLLRTLCHEIDIDPQLSKAASDPAFATILPWLRRRLAPEYEASPHERWLDPHFDAAGAEAWRHRLQRDLERWRQQRAWERDGITPKPATAGAAHEATPSERHLPTTEPRANDKEHPPPASATHAEPGATPAPVSAPPSAPNTTAMPAARPGAPDDKRWGEIEAAAAAKEQYPPTPQQRDIIEAAARRRLNTGVFALAGTGKTSVLKMLANRMTDDDIVYLAFNRSTRAEAERAKAAGEFPANLTPMTINALAMRTVGEPYAHRLPEDGHKGETYQRQSPEDIARLIGLRRAVPYGAGSLYSTDAATMALAMVGKWCLSASPTMLPEHVHIPRKMRKLQESHRQGLFDALLPWAEKMWDDILDPNGRLTFEQDYIVKIWSLSASIGTKIIFFDEAQDVSPVQDQAVRAAVAAGSQVVVVGDSNQSIYGFRGAEDALENFPVDIRLPLTQSWRFGPAIADAGNAALTVSGSRDRLQGNPHLASTIGPVTFQDADAVLAFTNTGVLKALVDGLDQGRRVAVIGGMRDVREFVLAARELQAERPTKHKDLAAFPNWKAVREYVGRHERAAGSMGTLVRLIDEDEEGHLDRLLASVGRGLDHVVVSTGTGTLHVQTTGKNTEAPLRAWMLDAQENGVGKFSFDGTRWTYDPQSPGNTGSLDDATAALHAYLAPSAPTKPGEGVIVDEKDNPNLVITTVHKAKGLEWDNVLIAADGPQPKLDPEGRLLPEQSRERLRLCYVALTRAVRRLDPGSLQWIHDAAGHPGPALNSEPTPAPRDEIDTAEVEPPTSAESAAPPSRDPETSVTPTPATPPPRSRPRRKEPTRHRPTTPRPRHRPSPPRSRSPIEPTRPRSPWPRPSPDSTRTIKARWNSSPGTDSPHTPPAPRPSCGANHPQPRHTPDKPSPSSWPPNSDDKDDRSPCSSREPRPRTRRHPSKG